MLHLVGQLLIEISDARSNKHKNRFSYFVRVSQLFSFYAARYNLVLRVCPSWVRYNRDVSVCPSSIIICLSQARVAGSMVTRRKTLFIYFIYFDPFLLSLAHAM